MARHTITWEDFNQETVIRHSDDQILHSINDQPLRDGDMIWLEDRPLDEGEAIEIVFKLGGGVTWWKEVKAVGHDNRPIPNKRIERSGSRRGPVSFRVRATDVQCFVFSKAKFLGIRTAMYSVGAPGQKKGRQLTFSWNKD